MSITYPLTMPTAIKNLADFTLRRMNPQGMSVSPFTGAQQVQASQGQWWEADFSLPPLTRAEADAWEAWALSLDGSKGTFLLGDPEHETPRGALGGNPAVFGSGQTGNELEVYGCTAGVAGWLLAGDFVQLGTGGTARLHRVLEDVETTLDGHAMLKIWPRLRRSPVEDEPLTTTNAQGVFRLKPGAMDFSRVPVFSHFSVTCVEVLEGN